LLVSLFGCQPDSKAPPVAPAPGAPASALTITYPFDGALFPPEIVAPTVRWTDPTGAALWTLEFKLSDGRSLTREARETSFRPDAQFWEELKAGSREAPLTLTIQGRAAGDPKQVLGAHSVRFATSSDPVGDALFYREVVLPFRTAVQDTRMLNWRFGTISQEGQPPVVLTGLPVCGNCHSFSRDGSVLGMDVDFGNDKGAYALVETAPQMSLVPERIISWKDLDPKDATKTLGLLPQVSPDGRFVMATVKDHSVFVAVDNNLAYSQLFFPIRGILGWYDRQEKRFGILGGADDPALVQSNPVWSPDGSELLFARAPKLDLRQFEDRPTVRSPADIPEFFGGGQKFRFDLYRIPFNGGAGGQAVPLEGASNNGKSNYFPRFSPDGKWLVFCQADSFMLLQPDATLFIMPATGGTPRKLRANRDSMNSWHSWSSNSRWLVFTSKLNGPYSQLFLTHIDAEGNDSPPVLLENFTAPDRAANIPEFVPLAADAIKKINLGFVSGDSYYQGALAILSHAKEKGNPEDMKKAAELLAASVKLAPENAEVRNLYGLALGSTGRTEEAAAQWREAIRLKPELADPYYHLALMHEKMGNLEAAKDLYQKASQRNPALGEDRRLALLLERLKRGEVEQATAELEAMVKVRPEWFQGLFYLANIKMDLGEIDQARQLFLRALAVDPNAVEAHWRLGVVYLELGQNEEAVALLKRAVASFPAEANLMDLLAVALAASGDFETAATWANKAIMAARTVGAERLIRTTEGHLRDIQAGRVPGL
jgi:tetratricopeptide (TPR) repeat protein